MVPPGQRDEAKLLETSVSRSFGGFLRGQAAIGFVYALVAIATSALLGLDFITVTTAASGLLMAIPFFGPFVSWAPPVIVAVFTDLSPILPTLILAMIGWFVVAEHPPAPAHGQRRRPPPDRRPRLGHHRREGRRRGRR
jgi:predicted PurR-regulated permease PerM